MAELSTINQKLFANTKNIAALDGIKTAVEKSNDAYVANNMTAVGQDVLQTVNGYASLDNNPIGAIDPDALLKNSNLGSTASQLTQLLPSASAFPTAIPDAFKVGVSAGTFVTTLVDAFPGDSANKIPILSVTGDSAVSTVKELISSLTGIVPPAENISIVSLTGAAIDDIVGAVEVAVARKKSLLSEIGAKAKALTVDADIGADAKKGLSDLEAAMDKAVASKDSLIKDVTANVSAIEGLANDVAKAAADAVGSATGGALDKIKSSLNEVSGGIGDGFESLTTGIGTAVGDLINSVTSEIETIGGGLQNLFEDITGTIGSSLSGLFSGGVGFDKKFVSEIMDDVSKGGETNLAVAAKKIQLKDPSLSPEMKKVISGAEATTVQGLSEVVESKAKAAGIPDTEITKYKENAAAISSSLESIDATISGSIVSQVGDFYTEDTDLAELAKRYLGSETTNFPYVDSKEELGLELYKMTRSISEVVVHASESYTNANIGSEEIHLRHNEAGHDGIQYHYVIRRDGRLQRGMDIETPSDASNILGHKPNCLDVCLVGGVNVPSEAEYPLLNLSASSFTQSQMKTLEALLSTFYRTQPGGQVMGHNNIDLNSQDPYFDVVSYVENKFGKKSVYKDLLKDTSLSAKDLIGKRPV